MSLFWMLLVIGFILIHMAVSLLAVVQVRRFWNLNHKTRFFTWSYLIAATLLDVLILVMFMELRK